MLLVLRRNDLSSGMGFPFLNNVEKLEREIFVRVQKVPTSLFAYISSFPISLNPLHPLSWPAPSISHRSKVSLSFPPPHLTHNPHSLHLTQTLQTSTTHTKSCPPALCPSVPPSNNHSQRPRVLPLHVPYNTKQIGTDSLRIQHRYTGRQSAEKP